MLERYSIIKCVEFVVITVLRSSKSDYQIGSSLCLYGGAFVKIRFITLLPHLITSAKPTMERKMSASGISYQLLAKSHL